MSISSRKWQTEASKKFVLSGNPKSFFVEACPGAGKTWFSLSMASELYKEDTGGRFIVIVSPTKNIRNKFCTDAYDRFDLNFKDNIPDSFPSGCYAGVSVTYSALVSRIENLRHWGKRFITVFDEVHHCDVSHDDMKPFGMAAAELASMSDHVLAMSGTPFRNVGVIPFLEDCKNEDWRYAYTYGDGVRDRVVRPVCFNFDDSEWSVRAMMDGDEVEQMGTASDHQQNGFKTSAIFSPRGDWVSQTIVRMANDIDGLRASGDRDAAGLFVCRGGDKKGGKKESGGHAKALSDRIYELTGEKPVLVLSENPISTEMISDFAKSERSRFIVSIRMVSEGVDIPRLRRMALMVATDSELLFRQMVGRVVRWEDGHGDSQSATIYLPEFSNYVDWATKIEEECAAAIKERPKPGAPGTEKNVRDVTGYEEKSSRGLESVFFRGEDMSPFVDLARHELKSLPGDHPFVQEYAKLLATTKKGKPVASPESLKKKYRKESDGYIRRLYFALKGTRSEATFSQINSSINKRLGVASVDDAHDNHPWEKMKERRDLAKELLEKARCTV